MKLLQPTNYRHELKYLCSNQSVTVLEARLQTILQTILTLLKNIEIKEEPNKLLSEKQKLKSTCSEFKTLIMHNN